MIVNLPGRAAALALWISNRKQLLSSLAYPIKGKDEAFQVANGWLLQWAGGIGLREDGFAVMHFPFPFPFRFPFADVPSSRTRNQNGDRPT